MRVDTLTTGVSVPLGKVPNPALEAAEKAEQVRRPLPGTLKDDEASAGAGEEGAEVEEAWKHSHVSTCVTPVSSVKSVCVHVHVCDIQVICGAHSDLHQQQEQRVGSGFF